MRVLSSAVARLFIVAAVALETTPLAAQVPVQVSASAAQNKEIVRRHLDLINRGDWKAAAEFFANDVRHQGITRGKSVLADNLQDIFTTFPDWRMEIVDMAADGDAIVVRCRVSGTHRGVAKRRVNGGLLVGVQPTGKHFEVQHMHWYILRGGKIIDHFASRDDLGMMQQLGLLPTGLASTADKSPR